MKISKVSRPTNFLESSNQRLNMSRLSQLVSFTSLVSHDWFWRQYWLTSCIVNRLALPSCMKTSKYRLIVKHYSKNKSAFFFLESGTFSHFQRKSKFKNSPRNCCLLLLALSVISMSSVSLYAPQIIVWFV